MTSSSPSGPPMDQLMYRSFPSQAEFPSVATRTDFHSQTALPRDKPVPFARKPAPAPKRVRESPQPLSAFAAPVQSPFAVTGTPLDYRQTLAVASSVPPSAYPKQQLHWDAGVSVSSDTSSPASPMDGGFGTDCSDDIDSGADSPSQTIELAGGGRLRAQGPYHLPDGGAAPFPVHPATQMRPPVSGSTLFELSPRAEESERSVAVNWTSPYAAGGPALLSPAVTPVSARVPTFFPRKLSSETFSTDLKQPLPFDLSPLVPPFSEPADFAELSSLSSSSPGPHCDSDAPAQSVSDGGPDSDTDGESPTKLSRRAAPAPPAPDAAAAPPNSGFKCRVCSRALRTEAHLACHMGVHTGERPCECPSCGQGFKTATDLANHARTHSLDKPFECAACCKAFKRRWELTRHMRVHTQDARPFECAECGKFFQTKTTLASHMRIHSDDKPFACAVCNKTFKRKGELTLHTRTHTGERPFRCPYCHKGFKQKGTLTQHLPTHTDHRPFTCSQCSSHFKHKSSLTRHVRCHKAAEALAAMGVPAQLRAQLQMRLELDVLKSESEPVDTVASDAQLPESDTDWLEACLQSTLSAPALPLEPEPEPEPELDPALTCFQCQIPFDHAADLAAHIVESHSPIAVESAPVPVSPVPLAPPALGAALAAPSLRFDAVFGPRSRSAVTAKKQPKSARPAHKGSSQAAPKASSGHFCPACGKHFKHKYSLTRHTARHHNHGAAWALAACPMCPQTFDSASLLSRHMVSAHGPAPRPSPGPLSSPSSVPSAHYSAAPVGDLARTFLFDGEAPRV